MYYLFYMLRLPEYITLLGTRTLICLFFIVLECQVLKTFKIILRLFLQTKHLKKNSLNEMFQTEFLYKFRDVCGNINIKAIVTGGNNSIILVF